MTLEDILHRAEEIDAVHIQAFVNDSKFLICFERERDAEPLLEITLSPEQYDLMAAGLWKVADANGSGVYLYNEKDREVRILQPPNRTFDVWMNSATPEKGDAKLAQQRALFIDFSKLCAERDIPPDAQRKIARELRRNIVNRVDLLDFDLKRFVVQELSRLRLTGHMESD